MGDIQLIHIQNDGIFSGHQNDGHQNAPSLSRFKLEQRFWDVHGTY